MSISNYQINWHSHGSGNPLKLIIASHMTNLDTLIDKVWSVIFKNAN